MPARTKILIAVLVLIGLGAGAFVVYDQNIKRQQREITESLSKSTKPVEKEPEAPKAPTMIESSTKDAAGEVPVTLEALKLMPEGSQMAVGIPPFSVLQEKIVPVVQLAFKNDLSVQEELDRFIVEKADELGIPSGDTALATFSEMGLDPSKASAVFLNTKKAAEVLGKTLLEAEKAAKEGGEMPVPELNPEDLEFVAVLPLGNKEQALSLLSDALGTPDTTETVGAVEVRLHEGMGAYFTTDAVLVLGNSAELVRQSAARLAAPAEFRYGTPACPARSATEMVMMIYARDLVGVAEKMLTSSEATQDPMTGPMIKAQFEQLKKMFPAEGMEDPVLMTMTADAKGLEMRSRVDMATHPGLVDMLGSGKPLRITTMLPDDTYAFFTLGLNDELKKHLTETYQSAAKADPRLAQAGTYVKQLMTMLGDEIVLGVSGLGADSFPGVYAAISVSNINTAQILLSLAGLQPETEYNGVQIGKITLPVPVPLYQAGAENVLMLSNSLDGLKALVDRVKAGQPSNFFASQKPPIDPEVPRYSGLFVRTGIYEKVARQIMAIFAPDTVPAEVDSIILTVGEIVRDLRAFNEMNGSWYESSISLTLYEPGGYAAEAAEVPVAAPAPAPDAAPEAAPAAPEAAPEAPAAPEAAPEAAPAAPEAAPAAPAAGGDDDWDSVGTTTVTKGAVI